MKAMIDENKIATVARVYCYKRYPASQDAPFISEGFRLGAKWAINEFLKALRHPVSEIPQIRRGTILAYSRDLGYRNLYNMYDMMSKTTCNTYQEMWEIEVKAYRLDGWIYADELFNLIIKGGENEVKTGK